MNESLYLPEPEQQPRVIEESIVSLKEAHKKVPRLEGVPTGIEGLDEMFFTVEWTSGKPRRVPLGGIPRYSVMNVTGVADTGKSLMVEQYALAQAGRGEAVIFVTVESPAVFVAMGMQERAKAMGISPDVVDERIIFIDVANYRRLQEDLPSLLATMAQAIKTYHAQHTIVDSVTGLFEHKEMAARTVVRHLFNFLKKWHQTGLFVSQKRSSHEEMSAEAAGGYAVAHIMDGTMVFSKDVITSAYKQKLYGLPIGEMIRLFRIDGCRLTGHDTRIHVCEITETGLVRIGPSLVELAAQRNV